MDGDNDNRIQIEQPDVSPDVTLSDNINESYQNLQLEDDEDVRPSSGQAINEENESAVSTVATGTEVSENVNISDINASHDQNAEIASENSSLPNVMPQPTHFFRLDYCPPRSRHQNGSAQPAQQEENPSDIESSGLSDATTAVVSDSEGWNTIAAKQHSTSSSSKTGSSFTTTSGVAPLNLSETCDISSTITSTLSSITSSSASSASVENKNPTEINKKSQESPPENLPETPKTEESQNLLPSLVLESPGESDNEDNTVVLESANVLLASTPTKEPNESQMSEPMLLMENLEDDDSDLIIPQSPDVFKFPPKILPSTPTEDIEEQDSQVIIADEDDKTVKTETKNEDDSVTEASKSSISHLVESPVVNATFSHPVECSSPKTLTDEQLAKGVEISPVKMSPSVASSVLSPKVSLCRKLSFGNNSQDSTSCKNSLLLESVDMCMNDSTHSKNQSTSESSDSSSKLFQTLTVPDSPLNQQDGSFLSCNDNVSPKTSSPVCIEKVTANKCDMQAVNNNSSSFTSEGEKADQPSDISHTTTGSISIFEENPTPNATYSLKCDDSLESGETQAVVEDSQMFSDSLKLFLPDSETPQLAEESTLTTTLNKASSLEPPVSQELCSTDVKDGEVKAVEVPEESIEPDSEKSKLSPGLVSETMELTEELMPFPKEGVTESNSDRDPFAMLRQPDLSFREMMLGLPGPSGLNQVYTHDSDTDSDSLEVKRFQKPEMSVTDLLKNPDVITRLSEQNLDKNVRGKGIGKKSKPQVGKETLKIPEPPKLTKENSTKAKSQKSPTECQITGGVPVLHKTKKNPLTIQEKAQECLDQNTSQMRDSIPESLVISATEEKSSSVSNVDKKKRLDSSLKKKNSTIARDKVRLKSVSEQLNSKTVLNKNVVDLVETNDEHAHAKESSPKILKSKQKVQKKALKGDLTKDNELSVDNVCLKKTVSDDGIQKKKEPKERKSKSKVKKPIQPKSASNVIEQPEEAQIKTISNKTIEENEIQHQENSPLQDSFKSKDKQVTKKKILDNSRTQSFPPSRSFITLSHRRRTSTPKNFVVKKLLSLSSKNLRKASSFQSSVLQKQNRIRLRKKNLLKQQRIITTIITKRIVTTETILGGFVIKREEKQYEDDHVTTEEIINIPPKKSHLTKSHIGKNPNSSTSLTSSTTTKSSSGSFADISSSISGNTPLFTASSHAASTSGESERPSTDPNPLLHRWPFKKSSKSEKSSSRHSSRVNPLRKRRLTAEESPESRRMKKPRIQELSEFSDNQSTGTVNLSSSSAVAASCSENVPSFIGQDDSKNSYLDQIRSDISTHKEVTDDKVFSYALNEHAMSPEVFNPPGKRQIHNETEISLSHTRNETKEVSSLKKTNSISSFPSEEEGKDCMTRTISTGCRVFAKWVDGYYYSGKIMKEEHLGRWLVSFDDNSIRHVNNNDIYRVNFLPVGSSVYAKLDDGCFDTGIITDIEVDGNQNDYIIELDNGGSKKIPVSSIMMTADQLICLFGEEKSPKTEVTSDAISLKNIVEGKRSSKARQLAPVSPQKTKTPQKKSRKNVTSKNEAPIESSSMKCLSITSASMSSPSAKSTPQKRRKMAGGDFHIVDQIEDPNLGPLLPKGNFLFKGKFFFLTQVAKGSADDDNKKDAEESLSSLGSISTEEFINHVPYCKMQLTRQIISGGGIILDTIEEHKPEHKECYLISNTHARTIKYIYCLAVGIPCISHSWIIDICKEKNKLLHYKAYLLPTGVNIFTKSLVEWHNRSQIFKDITMMIISSQDKNNFKDCLLSVLHAAGAAIVPRLSTCSSELPVVIISDMSCPPPSILRRSKKLRIPVVSTEWAVQCLILGKVLSFNAHPDFTIDSSE